MSRHAARVALSVVVSFVASLPGMAGAQPDADSVQKRLERLEENQSKLYDLLRSKDARIDELEAEVRRVKQGRQAAGPAPAKSRAAAKPPSPIPAAPSAPAEPTVAEAAPAKAPERDKRFFGTYEPGKGFGLARTDMGEVYFSAYTYVRYLNQKALDPTFVNGLGQEVKLDRRDDVNLNKVILYFKGWLYDPKFRYLAYAWTNNTSQGQRAQVVLGGYLAYAFDKAFTLGGGIFALPTVRSNEGAWPYFLGVDHRTLADEFFRGSYTMGFFANGEPVHGLKYLVGWGNNLSQLGVDAGRLNNDFTTVSGALWWMPTTGEFGPRGEFGDYAWHKDLATRIGAHFTFSPEDKQSQPGTEDPDNTQIRLSNGTNVFTPGALGQGVKVNKLTYYLSTLDAGLKYQGFALEGEYYIRWLNDFRGVQVPAGTDIFNTGFQLMASQMILPETLQLYGQGSHVFGDLAEPFEIAGGLNWYPFRRRELRVNLEYIYDRRSPVGYFAIPQLVGGTGSVVNANVELFF